MQANVHINYNLQKLIVKQLNTGSTSSRNK